MKPLTLVAESEGGDLSRMTKHDQGIEDAAVTRFLNECGDVPFKEVMVLIAALNEAESIGAVLDALPDEIGGLGISTVVIDDGSTDATADIASRHGAFVCSLGINRGHGVALRVGYRIAHEKAVRFVVMTDADGQYDMAEIPDLLAPLLADRADFVNGSRRLGTDETTDGVRRIGVRFFSWLLTCLLRQRITDTSSGFRAMRLEVLAGLTLTQPQYHASEQLVGVLCQGFRVLEVPMTMRPRLAGTTKKGGNLAYGLRYARVLVSTWWRESRCTAPSRPQGQLFRFGTGGSSTSEWKGSPNGD